MPKRLIINADDYGLAEDINRGIVECRTQGAVSDLSFLAAGEAFLHAAELARTYNIKSGGVHLALTGSFKATGPLPEIPSLVDKHGRFLKGYAGFLTRFFTGSIKKNHIYVEFKNQISRVKEEGFEITHLDSHQHIHMVPEILKIVVRLMKEEKIGHVRFSRQSTNIARRFGDPLGLIRYSALSPVCVLSKGLLDSSGVGFNDYYAGYTRAHRMRKEDFYRVISNLKDGLTEFGCHPGYFTEEVKNQYPQFRNCEEELKILCDKGFIDRIKTHSVELVSW